MGNSEERESRNPGLRVMRQQHRLEMPTPGPARQGPARHLRQPGGGRAAQEQQIRLNVGGATGTGVSCGLEVEEAGAVYSSWTLASSGWMARRGTLTTLLPFGTGAATALLSDGTVSLTGSLAVSSSSVDLHV
eukprot:tig00000459_g1136.t1